MAPICRGHPGLGSDNYGWTNPNGRYQAQGINLNGGGLAVLADTDVPIGAQIRVEFIPPHAEQPMTFRCFVRDRVGNRYGVEFITENDEDYRKTAELRERLAAAPAIGASFRGDEL